MEGGDLEYLVKNDFTTLPFERQLKIKSDGRPTPPLKEMKQQRGTTRKFRTFNPTQYSKTEWITGSANLKKLFCWPCVLFGKTTSNLNCPWATTGYDDLSNIYLALVRHGKLSNPYVCQGEVPPDGTSEVEL